MSSKVTGMEKRGLLLEWYSATAQVVKARRGLGGGSWVYCWSGTVLQLR